MTAVDRPVPPPMFTETLQIGIVVRDLEEAMRVHVYEYGIGPWSVIEMNPDNVADMEKGGRPEDYAMRTAVTMIGSVQWELIEPIGTNTIYSEFLAEHGEGLHHVLVKVAGFDEAVATMAAKGRPLLMGGNYRGSIRYGYLPTDTDLKYVTEIFEPPAGHKLDGGVTPDWVYPTDAGPR
jgi:methylmalonyl-CoA/ethylmalonyl-CoA epimerase